MRCLFHDIRITFVGGKQLHSTGQPGSGTSTQEEVKVYPPGAAVSGATPTKPKPVATGQSANADTTSAQVPTTPTQQATPTQEENEVEPVGKGSSVDLSCHLGAILHPQCIK